MPNFRSGFSLRGKNTGQPPPPNFPNQVGTLIFRETWLESPDYTDAVVGDPTIKPSSGLILDPTQTTSAGTRDDATHASPGNVWVGTFNGKRQAMGYMPAGGGSGSGTLWMRNWFGQSDASKRTLSFYIGIKITFSANFNNVGIPLPLNTGSKIFWHSGGSVNPDHTGWLYFTLNGADMDFGLATQNNDPFNVELYSNVGPAGIGKYYANRGNQELIEIIMTMSSGDTVNDGQLYIWRNGIMSHNYPAGSGVYLKSTGDRKWQSWEWNNTYGGGSNPIPADQFEIIEEVRYCGF